MKGKVKAFAPVVQNLKRFTLDNRHMHRDSTQDFIEITKRMLKQFSFFFLTYNLVCRITCLVTEDDVSLRPCDPQLFNTRSLVFFLVGKLAVL